MRENQIIVSPFTFLDLLEVEMHKEVNEHSTVSLVGIVPSSLDDDYIEKISSDQDFTVSAVDENEQEQLLFRGIIDNIYIFYDNQVRKLFVKGISYTYMMDIHKRIRTFQDANMTWKNVTDAIQKVDSNSNFIHPSFGSTQISKMIVQYYETDWEFSKRIASRLNTCIVPDYATNKPYLSIGLVDKKRNNYITPPEYKVKRNISKYHKNSARGFSAGESSTLAYEFTDRVIYDLCEEMTIYGDSVYIHSINSRLVGNTLIHQYTAMKDTGFCIKDDYNNNIVGASLQGIVKAIKNDVIQIYVDNDVDQTDHRWFKYATVYSTPDGTGWYFMPEVGDSIRLHFPLEDEHAAYTISSIHMPHDMRTTPDIKSISTVHDKKVVFKPDGLYITNGAGSTIELDDKKGILIDTSKELCISADDNITIYGKSKIIVKGDQGVTVLQNDNEVSITDTVDIGAGHVRIK